MSDHETTLRELANRLRWKFDAKPEAAACLAGADALRRGACAWTENENGAWDTACGRTWEFTNDGPVENRMTYCMGCGGRVHAPTEPTR